MPQYTRISLPIRIGVLFVDLILSIPYFLSISGHIKWEPPGLILPGIAMGLFVFFFFSYLTWWTWRGYLLEPNALIIKNLFRPATKHSFTTLTGWKTEVNNQSKQFTLFFVKTKISIYLSGEKLIRLCRDIVKGQGKHLIRENENKIKTQGLTIIPGTDIRKWLPLILLPYILTLLGFAFFVAEIFSLEFFALLILALMGIEPTRKEFVSRSRIQRCTIASNGLQLEFKAQTLQINWSEMHQIAITYRGHMTLLTFDYLGDKTTLSSYQFERAIGVFDYILKKIKEHHPDFTLEKTP